jgi:hypothetical protein
MRWIDLEQQRLVATPTIRDGLIYDRLVHNDRYPSRKTYWRNSASGKACHGKDLVGGSDAQIGDAGDVS